MKFTKKVFAIFLAIMLVGSSLSIMASCDEIVVTIDDQQVVFKNQGPIVTSGKALVPVREIFEALGFYPKWDSTARAVTLSRDDYVIVLIIGSYTFTTNDVEYVLPAPAQIIANRVLSPLCALLRSVGYDITDWTSDTRTIAICTNTAKAPTEINDRAYSIPEGFVRYTSAQYGFSLYHPEYWVHFDDLGGSQAVIEYLTGYYYGAMGLSYYYADSIEFTAQWLFPLDVHPRAVAVIRVAPNDYGFSQEMIQFDAFKRLFEGGIDWEQSTRIPDYERISDVTGAWLGENYFTMFMSISTYLGSEMSHFQANTVVDDYEFIILFITPRGGIDVELFKAILATFRA